MFNGYCSNVMYHKAVFIYNVQYLVIVNHYNVTYKKKKIITIKIALYVSG
jgi:hypothetical protein